MLRNILTIKINGQTIFKKDICEPTREDFTCGKCSAIVTEYIKEVEHNARKCKKKGE
ncbi:hypothetical protein [Clostridium ihumii]|uniref:hypothetical protein n=1 Tax=Clostridium ihumii TaxID=1470356 RepID=UPI000AC9A72A|nr:hypothetical protein [Clostridium ihumii]